LRSAMASRRANGRTAAAFLAVVLVFDPLGGVSEYELLAPVALGDRPSRRLQSIADPRYGPADRARSNTCSSEPAAGAAGACTGGRTPVRCEQRPRVADANRCRAGADAIALGEARRHAARRACSAYRQPNKRAEQSSREAAATIADRSRSRDATGSRRKINCPTSAGRCVSPTRGL